MPRERLHPQQDDARPEPRYDDSRGASAPAMRESSLKRRRAPGRSASTAVALAIVLVAVVVVLVFVL